MDNPETGDVSFECEGKSYTLRYTTAAFVALESYLDRGIVDIYDELSRWSPKFDPVTRKPIPETPKETIDRAKGMRLGFMRALFWAGMHDLHREVTVDEAGEIMTKIGGMTAAFALVMRGVANSQSDSSAGSAVPRPLKRSAARRRG